MLYRFLLVALAVASVACTPEQRVVRSTWDNLRPSRDWQTVTRGAVVRSPELLSPSVPAGPSGSSTSSAGTGAAGGSPGEGSVAAWNLARYPRAYSLQIMYYDPAFGPDFRKAAEEAVRVLREDGIEAYYYHGPHRSLVTVGLFSQEDFEQAPTPAGFLVEVPGPRIRQLQQQFPYSGANGRQLIQKFPDGSSEPLPSFLVRVP